ncbi:VWA domain-containing protein [Candidatus Woesearchaeota archaeon]|jgi:hypothetical protein|nr:VWA domain-containing protein [Candidatus Woesearchaeota archaeon]MBT5272285.1 VWA domain-containing protein [Candidatus Woesearchaeota archaeon]MBT6040614.1 VWA domain-containing protein [Candidatus Woesearchaeota archaeon]
MALLFIPAVVLLFILLIINFVKFEDKDKIPTRNYRIILFFTRIIILALLIAALTSPFVVQKETSDGNPEINILYDDSKSMDLFEVNLNALKNKLEKKIPTNIKQIASGTSSMLGDGVFRELHKKNLLLVTDGNNDKLSMDLHDVVTFAKKFNTTINALRLEEKKVDVSISLKGPSSSIVDTDYVFNVELVNAKNPVKVVVKINNNVVFDEETAAASTQVKHKFTQNGQFKIVAEIITKDLYDINNHYYHVVDVVPKPKVLYLSDKSSFVDKILNARYNTNKVSSLPLDLSSYYSVVINDKMDSITFDQGKAIEEFTDDGNGLIVIGGEKSFVTNTEIDLLLPVRKGTMEESGVDFNYIFLVDGSGYVSSKLTREELITNDILNNFIFRKEDISVAVLSFAHNSEIVSDWKSVKQKDDILTDMKNHEEINEIDGVKWYRPARLDFGLKKAGKMLEGKPGNNNIVVISDGAIYEKTFIASIELLKALRNQGIRVHSYNLANPDFEDPALKKSRQAISSFGRGMYIYNPQEANNLFEKNMIISNPNHWITRDLSVGGSLFRYNSVIPVASADVLVTTGTGIPLVSVNNYNKVGVISTDDGTEWAQEMYTPANIFLIYRVMDWGVGDPSRKQDSYVRVSNAIVNKETKVEYKGKNLPKSGECTFHNTEGDLYECLILPKEVGFANILGREYGINYDLEYKNVGFNDKVIEFITKETGGSIFDPSNSLAITEKAKEKAKIEILSKKFIDWYFVVAAMIVLLIEFLIRRVRDKVRRG